MTTCFKFRPLRMQAIILPAVAAILLMGCSPVSYQKDGVVVRSADGTRTAVNFASPSIVHVRAVPAGERFSRRESLCVLPQQTYRDWTREMKGDSLLVLGTSEMTVEIALDKGLVTFRDAEGRLLNAEKKR